MKLKALLAATFVAGLAASIAFASNGGGAMGDAAKPHCQQVELKGTLAAGSLSLSVEKANKAGKALGSSVTVAYGGKAKLHARLCQGAAGATPVLELRDLKVEHAPTDTTTTTTTTGH